MIASVSDQPCSVPASNSGSDLIEHQAKIVRILPSDQIALGSGPHRGKQVGGRLVGDVHFLDLAQAAGLGEANRFIDEPAVARSSAR